LLGVPYDMTADSLTVGDDPVARPGSAGEHLLQDVYGSRERAQAFYDNQMRDRLLPAMVEFVARMEMFFLSTSDGDGACDATLRSGPPGFLRVLDDRHLAYPEYRGNGVHASLGNITENPHVGLLMIDFERDLIGLHVNGRARIVDDDVMRTLHPELPVDALPGRRAEHWVLVEVAEAYVHCRKHIPRMARVRERRDWGTDDPARKGGDYFGAKAERDIEGHIEGDIEGDIEPGTERGTERETVWGTRCEPPPIPAQQSVPLFEVPVAEEPVAEAAVAEEADAAEKAEKTEATEAAPDDRGDDSAANPSTLPLPVQPDSGPGRFPSTTHLLTGAATARPLRPGRGGSRALRRIRWLSS
jgi:hypothetical protein